MPLNKTDERTLIVAPLGQDAAAMAALLQEHGSEAKICTTLTECCHSIERGAGAVLLTEEALTLPNVPEFLATLKTQPAWSELPLIVLTSGGESRMLELLDLVAEAAGSLTLLERPMNSTTLLRSIQVALRARQRQYQVRDLLDDQRAKQRELELANAKAEKELAERRLAEEALGKWAHKPLLNQQRSVGLRYMVAMVSVAIAVGLRYMMTPVLGERVPFIILFGAIALSVWYGGFGPALMAALGGYFVASWLFISPHQLFRFEPGDITMFAFYLTSASLIIAFGLLFRRAQAHAQASARVAIERQHQVERESEVRKQAEEARFRLAAITESSEDAILSKDLNGIITSWNAGAERLFGYTARETIGQPVTMLMPPERLEEEPTILGRIRRRESVGNYETIRRRKDGSLIHISLTVSPVVDSEGRIVGASKIARDITKRKAAEEALRESEERFRQLADNIAALAWMAHADGAFFWYRSALVQNTPERRRRRCVDGAGKRCTSRANSIASFQNGGRLWPAASLGKTSFRCGGATGAIAGSCPARFRFAIHRGRSPAGSARTPTSRNCATLRPNSPGPTP